MLELSGETLAPIQGIYEIKNTETGQCYIGKSIQIPSRWATHFTELGTGKHSLILMQRDWDRYGPDAFTAAVVKVVANEDELYAEEDAIALERLESGAKLYNAAIAGWVNEDERAARLARKRADEQKKRRVLQRKRERLNETRNSGQGNSGNKGAVRKERGIQGRGGVSRDSARAPVESTKRGVRKPQAGVQSGEQGADRKARAKRSAPKGMDENRRHGKGHKNDKEALPIFDDFAARQLTRYLPEEDREPYLQKILRDSLRGADTAVGLALVIRAAFCEDDVRAAWEVLDPKTLVVFFDNESDFERARRAVGADRTAWLLEQIGDCDE